MAGSGNVACAACSGSDPIECLVHGFEHRRMLAGQLRVDAVLGTARKIGLDRLLGPDGNRCRDLSLALVVSRILDPGSKLAAARALSPDTATSSLGEQLALGVVVGTISPGVSALLSRRRPKLGGTYYVSGSLITKDRTEATAGLRIPAKEIERLVTDRGIQVRRRLAAGGRWIRTIGPCREGAGLYCGR
jgi:hypothetical protein